MDTTRTGEFDLHSQRLGALPLVNHFWYRARLPELLERYLPATDARVRLAPAAAVRLVVTNLLLGRRPLYALGQWAAPFAPGLLGLAPGEVDALNDDRVGRALEQLFDADRASLLTELMLGVIAEFGVATAEVHNDSTSISVHGVYRGATGAPPWRQAHPGDHLRAFQGPPPRPQTAGVDPDRVRRRGGPDRLPTRRGQHHR